ncbi:MAG TPA: dTDP-4-dehydrorhamnose reductase [Tepidisphaeraceae bacterium]|nr:dTDP-4-dehydrorhamnose reductase [Tepidisphaeraceae bacterium]
MPDVSDSIVITGGGGMLGHALADALAHRGRQAVALTRAECDIANDDDIHRIFERPPTLLLNCAAHTKVDLCEQESALADAINGTAVGKIAKLAREHGTYLVHVSTDFVFEGHGTHPYKIDDPVKPLSAYGRSKLLGETELQKNAPRHWLIVRTAWVYGRYGANFPRTMVSAARAGKPLSVVRDQVGSPTYTVDLAEAILALVDARANGIVHVTNAGETNWFEFAKAALETFGIDHPVAAITAADWQKLRPNTAARPSYSVLDLRPYEGITGKTMRPWREALSDFRKEVDRAGAF